MAEFYLPGVSGQVEVNGDEPVQASPLLNTYSPRLFGAPPQLTHLNDMRLLSSDGNLPGPVGDFYLTDILRDAQVANFVVGRALFTGGMSTFAEFLRTALNYGKAMSKYKIYDNNSQPIDSSSASSLINSITEEKIQAAMENNNTLVGKEVEEEGGHKYTVLDLDSTEYGDTSQIQSDLTGLFGEAAAPVMGTLLTSMSVQQPFYTFDSDWYSYINNVKMMINTGVIMLGLQKACVRIGDQYLPIGMAANVSADTDVWSNYRFITPSKGLGTITAVDTQSGDTSQYVSFMLEPNGVAESYSNTTQKSQIYSSVINQGSTIGNEIAFITNSSVNKLDDAVLSLAGKATNVAESVLSNLTLGAGKFTAAIAGSMARSFVGDHTIYPEIFNEASASSSMTLKTKLVARAGDAYSFLIDIWVPMCFALCMGLPQMAKNNAAAYAFPPLVQCSIPGSWGTRLGIIDKIDISKNNDGKSLSVHGFPTSVELSIGVKDLQHVMVSSPMNDPARFLNNNTMFDYIAQSCGCDKYKVNGSIRLVSKLALAASTAENAFYNIGNAILNDWTSTANRILGTGRY